MFDKRPYELRFFYMLENGYIDNINSRFETKSDMDNQLEIISNQQSEIDKLQENFRKKGQPKTI